MARTSTHRCWHGGYAWSAALAVIVCLVAPHSLSAQSSSESESEASNAEQEETSSTDGQDEGPTPEMALLPTHSIGDDISDLVPERIGEMLRKRAGSDDRLKLLSSFRNMRQEESQEGSVSQTIAKAREQYKSGIGLLNAGKFEKSSEKLKSAVELIKGNVADLREFDVLVDALAKLSRAYFEAGYDFDARKRITEYAHLRPNAELNPDDFPEGLRKIYKREARKVDQAGTSTIAVETDAEQATVWLDGEEKGTAPLKISDATYGYHYLVVKDPRGRSWAKRIQVPGRDRTRTFQPTLEGEGTDTADDSRASSASEDGGQQASEDDDSMPAFYTELRQRIEDGSFSADDVRPYFKEFADETGATYVAWVSMFRNDGSYTAAPFVYRASDGRIVRIERTDFNVQLSDLRVGVSTMSTNLVETTLEMPDKRAVQSVTLVEPEQDEKPEAVASSSAETSSESESVSSAPSDDTSTEPTSPPASPPEPAPKRQNRRVWTYVGIGGAVLAVGGLVAGGFALFGGDQSPSRPPGFTANVSW